MPQTDTELEQTKFFFAHRLETYKSMIAISVEGFKYLALLNGGAAAGLMSGLEKLKDHVGICALKAAIACFALGLVMNFVAFFCSYFTQNTLFNESFGRAKQNCHIRYVVAATIFCVLSIFFFASGCFSLLIGLH